MFSSTVQVLIDLIFYNLNRSISIVKFIETKDFQIDPNRSSGPPDVANKPWTSFAYPDNLGASISITTGPSRPCFMALVILVKYIVH